MQSYQPQLGIACSAALLFGILGRPTLVLAGDVAPADGGARDTSLAALTSLDLHAWVTTPTVSTVAPVVGGGFRVVHPLAKGLCYTAEFDFGSSDVKTPSWRVTEKQFVGSVGVVVSTRVGVGQLFAVAQGGVRAINELSERISTRRLEAADLPTTYGSTWSVGPLLSLRVGVSVEVFNRWRVVLSAGPSASVVRRAVTGRKLDIGSDATGGVEYGW